MNESRAEAEAQYGKRECDIVVVEGDGVVDAAEKDISSVEATARRDPKRMHDCVA